MVMEDLSPDTVAVQIIDFSAELEGEKKVKSKMNLNVLLLLSLMKETSCRLPVLLSQHQDKGWCCLQLQHYLTGIDMSFVGFMPSFFLLCNPHSNPLPDKPGHGNPKSTPLFLQE